MTIGSIVVDLLARTGSFETDLNRAAKQAEKRAKEIDAAVSKAGAAVGTALGAAGIAAVYFGKQLIDGLDALNDVADATGASIENISALENVAMRTGSSMDTVTGTLVKFNNVLKEVDGKNAASQALKALGLDAQELKRIDPAEALHRTAVALAGFADDGNKARLVQELFGKSIREVAPLLKDLAEKTELVGTVSAEQAANAEIFNKQIFAMKANATEAARSIVGDLLPALNQFLRNAADIKKMGGFGLIVKDAAKDMIGLGRMTGDNGADIKRLMAEREKLQAEMDREARPLVRANDSRKGDIEELNRYLALLRMKQRNEIELANMGQDFGDAVSRRTKKAPSLPEIAAVKEPKKAGTPKDSEHQKYLENLGKELSRTEELSRAGMVLADIQSGRLKLLKGESAEPLLAIAREIDANKELTEEKKRRTEFDAQLRESVLQDAKTQEQQVKSLAEGNKAMREEIELIGKNAEAQGVIEQARLSSLIAMKEQELAEERSTEILTRKAAALEEEIRLLTERKELVGLKGVTQQIADDAKKTEELANSIGAAFSSSFEKAALEGGKLSDVLKGLGKDIAALVLRQTITVPLSNSIARALQTGTPAVGAGGAGGGGGFDFGSLITTAMRFIGGAFADGGSPPVGKVSLVGERGPELFVPNTAGKIIPNHALGGGGRLSVSSSTTPLATLPRCRS
ncbi:hypothetical protein M0765_026450 [Variovorax sp. S2]|uniref:hypothetical protein n=1 Tax=Variovorax sp. S12S4 TaxID=3029170 RepID=UPI00215BABEB|nr:hypothetical protein [Variovorax sp. S12S4]MCR8961140.1 hypothetical protein [Variovorax sp. S12S4]